MTDKTKTLIAKLRYMARQYTAGSAARGGQPKKHYLDEAADEIERLQADAGRYQWLRSEHERFDPVCHLSWKHAGDRNGGVWVNTANLDADIDAAMKEQP